MHPHYISSFQGEGEDEAADPGDQRETGAGRAERGATAATESHTR